ncbi:MAG: phosphatidylserine decarboxylase family protein [Nitrospirota bacterium]
MIKFAPEGYPFIFGALFLTIIASIVLLLLRKLGAPRIPMHLAALLLCSSFIATLFMTFFFRDPERATPAGEGLFVSPADGKVILTKDVYEKEYLKADAKEISIFMSPLDVHVNRAPCDGAVAAVRYTPGKFFAAYSDDAATKNENIAMVLEGNQGRILVRQVAGFLARRAVCRVKVGDRVRRGERYGIIKFSSRLDVYLPEDAKITVKVGDKVKAGETVIAKKR